MNYIINIKTRDLIVCGILAVIVASKAERKAEKYIKKIKKEKVDPIFCDCISDDANYIYCPVCGKKVKDC